MSWLSKLSGKGKSPTPPPTVSRRGSVPAPKVLIGRLEYEAEEFAIGSFRVRPYEGDLIARQQFDFRIVLDQAGEPLQIPCRGVVVRMDDEHGLIARYQSPPPVYLRKLADYLQQWRGA